MERSAAISLLQFDLDGQLYALQLEQVERVIRAVELRPLPESPPVIRGIFSLHGRILAVADPRRRVGLPDKEIALEDRIIIARTPARMLGLLAQGDVEVVEYEPHAITEAECVVSGLELVEGVGRLPDGLVLIQNLANFLSLDEERRLEEAINAGA
jgi:purine-binding chemotaxis protein CheW